MVATPPRHTVLCTISRRELDHIILNKLMVKDHLLDSYEDGLQSVLRNLS